MVPDSTKPLPETMLANHQWDLVHVAFTWGQFTCNGGDIYPWYEFENYSFQITTTSPRDKWINSRCQSLAQCWKCDTVAWDPIGKTPVKIILWCPTKMLIKACFLIQPLEQEGGCQKCCISLCSKVFINHRYQMKASPECLHILMYWSKYWVDRLRRTPRRKV